MDTYILKGDEVVGPLSRIEIMEGLADGSFSKDDYCAREGWDSWKRIGEVYKERPIVKNPPPLSNPKQHKVNRSRWRDDPVTARQQEFIRSKGKKVPKTKGEASDLISSLLGTGPSPRQIAKLKFLGLTWASAADAFSILDAIENDPAYTKRISEWDAKKTVLYPDLYNSDGSYRDDIRLSKSKRHNNATRKKKRSGYLSIILLLGLFLLFRALVGNKDSHQKVLPAKPNSSVSLEPNHLQSTPSTPQSTSTPSATPTPFPESQFWPDKVHLLKPITFVGSIAGGVIRTDAPVGTFLPAEISSDHRMVIIHNLDLSTSVPIEDTDFLEIANKRAQQK